MLRLWKTLNERETVLNDVNVEKLSIQSNPVEVSAKDINQLDGIQSNVQAQLDSKLDYVTGGTGITIDENEISVDLSGGTGITVDENEISVNKDLEIESITVEELTSWESKPYWK